MTIELEKLDKVSPESVDFVEECLINIGRVDLARKVTAYKMPGETVLPFNTELLRLTKCKKQVLKL